MFLPQLWHTQPMQTLDTETHVFLAYALSFTLIALVGIGSILRQRSTRRAIARIKHVSSHEA